MAGMAVPQGLTLVPSTPQDSAPAAPDVAAPAAPAGLTAIGLAPQPRAPALATPRGLTLIQPPQAITPTDFGQPAPATLPAPAGLHAITEPAGSTASPTRAAIAAPAAPNTEISAATRVAPAPTPVIPPGVTAAPDAAPAGPGEDVWQRRMGLASDDQLRVLAGSKTPKVRDLAAAEAQRRQGTMAPKVPQGTSGDVPGVDSRAAATVASGQLVDRMEAAEAQNDDAKRAREPWPAQPPANPLRDAIFGQESGGQNNTGWGPGGSAYGPAQITPDTFARYAKPGEQLGDPAANRAVGERIIADLSRKFGGDPARVATAYFSGPANVAPPGSPTPWKRDVADASGKSVSSYVTDILGRMPKPAPMYNEVQSPPASAAAPADLPTAAPAGPGPAQSRPGFAGAFAKGLMRGVAQGAREVAQAPSAFRDQAPPPEPNDGLGELLQQPITEGWKDPSWWAAKVGTGLGHSAPVLGGMAAGSLAGAATPMPGGALIGSALGGGAMGFVQELAPAYQAGIASGLTHDQAVDRAMEHAGISGAFSALMAVAPGATLFGKTIGRDGIEVIRRPISEALAQIFGVQPGLGAAEQAAHGAVDQKLPTAEQFAEGYAVNAATGAAIVGAHAAARHANSPEELWQRYQQRQQGPGATGGQGGPTGGPNGPQGGPQPGNPGAPPPRGTSNPAGLDADGRFSLAPGTNFVQSDSGAPIWFADQKAAALWILRQARTVSPDQIFELANHPTQPGFTVYEYGRQEAPAAAAPSPEPSPAVTPEPAPVRTPNGVQGGVQPPQPGWQPINDENGQQLGWQSPDGTEAVPLQQPAGAPAPQGPGANPAGSVPEAPLPPTQPGHAGSQVPDRPGIGGVLRSGALRDLMADPRALSAIQAEQQAKAAQDAQDAVSIGFADGTSTEGWLRGYEGDTPILELPGGTTLRPSPQSVNLTGAGVDNRRVGTGERAAPVQINTPADVAAAAAVADPNPTPAQKEAGNYQKGHATVQGLPVTIENAAGSLRSGIGPGGQPWSVTMPAAYGYVKGTTGADGDQVDVYLGDQPTAPTVYVVDQIDPQTGAYDEHKALIGFPSRGAALTTYRAAFSDGSGLARIGAITALPIDQFKAWLDSGKTKEPLAYKAPPATAAAGVGSPVDGGDGAPPALAAAPGAATAAWEAYLGAAKTLARKTSTSLRPEPFAQALGATPAQAARVLQQLAADGVIWVRRSRQKQRGKGKGQAAGQGGGYMRPPSLGPLDMIHFLMAHGGLKDTEGHRLVDQRDAQRFHPRFGALIRAGTDGMGIDEAGELLWEHGYFGPPRTTVRPDESQVLERLDEALSGKKFFSVFDQAEMAQLSEKERAEREAALLADTQDEVRAVSNQENWALPDDAIEEVARLMLAHDMAIGDAADEVMERIAHELESAFAAAAPEAHADADQGVPFDAPARQAEKVGAEPAPARQPAAGPDRGAAPGGPPRGQHPGENRPVQGREGAESHRPESRAGGEAADHGAAGDAAERQGRPAQIPPAAEGDGSLGIGGDAISARESARRATLKAAQDSAAIKAQEGKLRKGGQTSIRDQSGGLFSAERDQTDIFSAPKAPETASVAAPEAPVAPRPLGKQSRGNRKADSSTETPAFKTWFRESKVVDAAGKPLRVYRGDYRDVGPAFKTNRATSGRFYFTTDPKIASNYATGKSYLNEDYADFSDWFRFPEFREKGERRPPNLATVWYRLTPEQKERVKDTLLRAKLHEQDRTVEFGEPDGGINSRQGWDYEVRRSGGNWLLAAKAIWLEGAVIFNEEHQFLDVLKRAGLKGEFDDPRENVPVVTPVYLSIQKPLNTSAVDAAILDRLRQAVGVDRSRRRVYGADIWDKTTITPREWLDELANELAAGKTGDGSHAWTRIPDRITTALQALGYDGIEDVGGKFGGEKHSVWIAFEPGQIKSVHNQGTWKADTGKIMYSRRPTAPVFYSALQRGVEAIQQPKAPPAQWRAIIANLTTKGVKQEEIDWSGVLPWLSTLDGTVTKQQVADYLKANEIQVSETLYGTGQDAERPDAEAVEKYKPELEQAQTEIRTLDAQLRQLRAKSHTKEGITESDLPKGWNLERNDAPTLRRPAFQIVDEEGIPSGGASTLGEALIRATENELSLARSGLDALRGKMMEETIARLPPHEKGDGPTRYGSYTTPGGENYRELLLKLPERPYQRSEVTARAYREGHDSPSDVNNWIVETPDNVYSIAKSKAPTEQDAIDYVVANKTVSRPEFQSSHWQKPNVVAHVRFSDRTAPDGKKVLYVQEVQSDWHQGGRKRGYLSPDLDTRYQAAEQRWRTAGENLKPILRKLDQLGFDTMSEAFVALRTQSDWATAFDIPTEDQPAIADYIDAFNEMRALKSQQAGGVPNAPFKTTWPDLVMKRMIRWSAEHGYDRLAWATGESNADVFGLQQHIAAIRYEKNDDGTFNVVAYGPGHHAPDNTEELPRGWSGAVLDEADVTSERLRELVGQELATKIEGGEGIKAGSAYRDWRELSGLDLKTGGEGMKAFYDRMLPASVGKYVKKWGAKVEQGTIGPIANRFDPEKPWEVFDTQTGEIADRFATMEEAHNRRDALVRERPIGFWDYGRGNRGEKDTERPVDAWHVDITPAMHDAAMAGQPLFKRTGSDVAPAPKAGPLAKPLPSNEEIIAALKKARDQIGLNDVQVKVLDAITDELGRPVPDATAYYYRGVIQILRGALSDMLKDFHHEALHALRDMGLLTDADWKPLAARSNAEWRKRLDVDALYSAEDGFTERDREEEGVAETYARWAEGKAPTGGLIRRAFNKIKALLGKLREALLGAKPKEDWEQIFEDIAGGKVGARERQGAPAEPVKGSASIKREAKRQGRAAAEGNPENQQAGHNALRNAIAWLKRPRGKKLPSVADIGRFANWVNHPSTIAAFYPQFTPVYDHALSMFQQRDRLIEEMTKSVGPYMLADGADKKVVNAVLEHGRLEGQQYEPAKDGTITVKNTYGDLPGFKYDSTIKLTPDQAKAYKSVRKTMDRALDLFKLQVLREYGFGKPGDPMSANGVREFLARGDNELDAGMKARLEQLADKLAEVEDARKSGYVPFTRYGTMGVTVTRRNELGGRPIVEHFETVEVDYGRGKAGKLVGRRLHQGRVEALRQRLLAKYPEKDGFSVGEAREVFPKTGAEDLDLNALDQLATIAGADPEAYEAVRDAIDQALKEASFKKHFFQARQTPGYSRDFERSIADYIIGISGYIARRNHREKFDMALKGIRRDRTPTLYDYAKDYLDYIQSPVEEWQNLRFLTFLYYLGGNVSSALVNTTQVPLVTMPTLAQFAGVGKVTAELGKAYADAMAMLSWKPGSLLPDVDPSKAPAEMRDDFTRAWLSGIMVPVTSLDQMALSNGRVPEWLRGKTQAVREVADKFAAVYTAAERLNRMVTWIASHRLYRQPGVAASVAKVMARNHLWRSAMDASPGPDTFARLVVDDTQFRQGKVNRPRVMRGAGAALLQFKAFTLHMLEAIYRIARQNGRAALKAAGLFAAVMIGFGGVFGLPFAEDLRDLVEAITNKVRGRDLDIEQEVYDLFNQMGSPAWITESLLHGPFRAATGADISRRVGMGQIVPRGKDITDAGMPFEMTWGRFSRALEFAAQHRYLESIGQGLPSAVANPLQAYSWSQNGVQTQGGNTVIAPKDLSAYDLALKALGVQPTDVSRARELANAQRRAEQSGSAYRRTIYLRVAQALADQSRAQDAGDQEAAAAAAKRLGDVIGEVQAFNAKATPDQLINLNGAKPTIKQYYQQDLEGAAAKKHRRAATSRMEEINESRH